MSKRRNRKKSSQPNLPPEALARARREAGMEPEEPEDTPEAEAELVEAAEVPAARTRAIAPAPAQRRKRRRDKDVDATQLTQAEIAERLASPTKTVTPDQLRQQYTYVLADLRSMGALAGILFVTMIVVAQLLSR